MFDFIRVATAVPDIVVGDTSYNTNEIKKKINEAVERNTDIIVFPELSITGYTCADLFGQKALINSSNKSIKELLDYTENLDIVVIVGAPISILNQLYNCALVLSKGKISGIVPKTFLHDYGELNEKRWFSSSKALNVEEISSKTLGFDAEYNIPVSRNIIFDIPNLARFGIEICEDSFSPIPTGSFLSLNGAELIINISAMTT